MFRIVGGCSAGHTPWYVFIKLETTKRCGGSLINKFWVLSAAHCFCHKEDPDEKKQMICKRNDENQLVPIYDISNKHNLKVYIGSEGNTDIIHSVSPWKSAFGVSELIIHHKYNKVCKI